MQAQVYPPDFDDQLVVSGLQEPTTFLHVPDGRILIAERSGKVRVFENGTLLSAPMLSLAVETRYEQGLLGMALDPGFPNPPHLYVCYSVDNGSNDFNRVSRWTLAGNSVVAGSEFIVIQNIPTGQGWHVAGGIRFANDGNLLIAMGDAGYSSRVQSLTGLEGKLLRMQPDGGIPPDNPFLGVSGARPEIYLYGLRNPFRFTIQPGTGLPFLCDVGYNSWEEVNIGVAGGNYGWPTHEGFADPPSSAYVDPLYVYDHGLGSAAISGSVFYYGSALPPEYQGNYFFFDHVRGHLGRMVLDPDNNIVSVDPRWIETAAIGWGNGPVELLVGPEGTLDYCVYSPGSIRRIRYTGNLNRPPTAIAVADSTSGYPPFAVQFDASSSFDLDNDPLTFEWDFGDGSAASTALDPVHVYTGNGVFAARVTVRDGRGGEQVSQPLSISVGNLAPTLHVVHPLAGRTFVIDEVIPFMGWAEDFEDGLLTEDAVHWRVDLRHSEHLHPVIQDWVGFQSSFVASSHGENPADLAYRVTMWAEDSNGLRREKTVEIRPDSTLLVGSPPVLVSSPATTALIGTTYSYQASASGSAPFAWSLPVAPAWLQVSPLGLVFGTPDASGTQSIVLQVHNAAGLHEQSWDLFVGSGSGPRTEIALGDTWKYLPGSSDPGPAWADIGFDDSAWAAGPSGFGYGDNDDATVLADMRDNYTTVFTRRVFLVGTPAAITEVAVRFGYDDGFAVLLNGTQLLSRNAPASITNTSLATVAHEANGSLERQAFTDPATLGLLQPGTNVLAAVGLNVSLGSSDLTLQIELELTELSTGNPTDAGLPLRSRTAPNPFTSATAIAFDLATGGAVRLDIYDAGGRRVHTQDWPRLPAGAHRAVWQGIEASGKKAPAGLYFYRITGPALHVSGKLVRTH